MPSTERTEQTPEHADYYAAGGDYTYACDLYDVLTTTADKTGLWVGRLSEAISAANVPSYRQSILLKEMQSVDAIELIQRGNSRQPTKIMLITHPKILHWNLPKGLTKSRRDATLSLRVDNISKQIGGLNVPDAVRSLDTRLLLVENELKALRALIAREVD